LESRCECGIKFRFHKPWNYYAIFWKLNAFQELNDKAVDTVGRRKLWTTLKLKTKIKTSQTTAKKYRTLTYHKKQRKL
jgi:hypothetical protein